MSFVVILVCSCIFVAIAAKSIKAVPLLWYCIAVALDIVYAYSIVYGFPPVILQVLSVLIQRCMLAAALFIIVMYCGVFPKHSVVRKTVGSIRAELSIIACILAFAHCLNYLNSYLGVLSKNIAVISNNQLASLILAILLFALLLLLGVTSLKTLRCQMKYTTWKNIQRSSYLFFALIFAHAMLILYPSAIKDSGDALLTLIVYGIVFVVYFVLRLARYFADRKSQDSQATAESDEEGVNCG